MASQGSRYNKEFKADIIRLITEENKSVNKVAKDFGVINQTVRNWLKAAVVNIAPENSRIAELAAQLKEEKRKQLIYSKR